ncbi:MAG: DUF1697 domain-containing protein [Chloroflexi bacterium]|nr:DUF1697 domain-containing protein [Chloroflexota bacterium]
MHTYIILLRAVTPTGKNKVPMAPLRAALEQAGLSNVRTYIQSGNVIARAELSQPALETLVHEIIKQQFGGDIAVLARPVSYLHAMLMRNPFANADPAKLYFTLLAEIPPAHAVSTFLAPGYAPDQVQVIDDMVYICCATTYSQLKANNTFIERKLKLPATTRVSKTMTKLVALGIETEQIAAQPSALQP